MSRIDLDWTAGIPGTFPLSGPYTLERAVNAGGFSSIATVQNASPRIYSDFDVSAGNTYHYRVKVIDSQGSNTVPEWSNVVTIEYPLPVGVYLIGSFVDNDNLAAISGSMNMDLPYTPASDGNADRVIVVEILMSDQGGALGTPQFGGQNLTLAGTQNHTASGYNHRFFVYYRKLTGAESSNILRFPISGAGEINISFRATTWGNAAIPVVGNASAESIGASTVTLGSSLNATGLTGAMLIECADMVGAKASQPLQLSVDTAGVTYIETDYPTITASVLTETRPFLNSATGRLAYKNVTNEIVNAPVWTGTRNGGVLPVWLSQVGLIIPRV